MKRLLAVVRLYVSSVINIEKPKNPKAWAKMLGLGLVMTIASAEVLVMFIVYNSAIYSAYQPLGLQALLLSNGAVSGVVLSLVLGLLTLMSMYFTAGGESHLLSMPIKSFELLSGKFALTYLLNLPAILFVAGPALGVYAFHEHPGPGFYLMGLLGLLALPIIPISVVFTLLILLMRVGKPLRNKTFLQYTAAVIGVAFAIGFNILFQGVSREGLMAMGSSGTVHAYDASLSALASLYPPASLFAWSLTGGSAIIAVLDFVALLATSVAIAAVVILVLARPYTDSLPGFLEIRIRKLKNSAQFIGKEIRRTSMFWTLLKREIVSMNREPTFFFNGPFVLVLMPAILVIMAVVQGASILPALDKLVSDPALSPYFPLISAAVGIFLSTTTLIAGTAFSREGKAVQFLKAMPVNPVSLGVAKIAHASIFNALAALLGVLAGVFVLRLGFLDAVLAFVMSLSVSTLLSLLGLLVDTNSPKLNWDNPLKALKSNPNSIIAMFGSWAVVALLVFIDLNLSQPELRILVPILTALAGCALVWPLFLRLLRARWERWEL